MEETRNSPYCNGEDKFSRLPDSLIHYILSFDDTKFAVQTCVLSKRWLDVWKSLPSLCFNRNSFSEHKQISFIMFVDMVLIRRRKDIDIQKFSLDWENSALDNTVIMHVNRWSVHAVEHNVQKISINIEHLHNSVYEIPHCLLNCKSLRKLKIQVFGAAGFMDFILPRSMNSPQLKVLYIYGLSISNVELSTRFFSSFPVLEMVRISGCDNQRNLIVDSLSLKKFIYYSCWHRHFPAQSGQGVANIIKLCAPNLKEFIWSFYLAQDYSLEICSPLSGVSFLMVLREEEEEENPKTYEKLPSKEIDVYAKRMMKFLRAVCMVKYITVSPGFLEVLSRAPDLLDCPPLHLRNVDSLVLRMWCTRGCLRAISYLLNISPNITTLFIELMESNLSDVGDKKRKKKSKSDIGDDWEAGLSLPEMLSHLWYVEFIDAEGPEGCDAEFKLLSFLMKNAKALKKVGVTFRSTVSQRDRMRQVKQYRKKIAAGRTGIQFAYNLKFSY